MKTDILNRTWPPGSCWAAGALACAMAWSALAQDKQRDAEVRALIAAIETSPCRFERNGSWHTGPAAARHLRRKHEAAREQGLPEGAEAFVREVASRSSFTGQPYRIHCGREERETPAQETGPWLMQRLQAIRQERAQP